MKLPKNDLMSLDIVRAKLSAEWLIGAGLPMAEPASPWWSRQPKRYVRSPQHSLPDLHARTGWHGDAQRTCAGRFHRLRHCRGRGMAQLTLVSSAAGARVLPDPVSRARPGSRIKLSRIRCNASALLVGGRERRIGAALIVSGDLLSSNRKIMGEYTASPFLRALGWLTAAVMAVAAVSMFL